MVDSRQSCAHEPGFLKDGKPHFSAALWRDGLKIYPLKCASNPPKMEFVNVSGKTMLLGWPILSFKVVPLFYQLGFVFPRPYKSVGPSAAHLYAISCAVCLTILAHSLALRPYVTSCPRNTIHSNDFGFFNEVNDVIQREPVDFLDPELRGNLAAIGIRKGQPFKPDARMTGLLTEGVPLPQAMPEGRIDYLPHTNKPGPILVPVPEVPHKAVAEVSRRGKL